MSVISPPTGHSSIRIAPVTEFDAQELISANITSRAEHGAWVSPPTDHPAFQTWYRTQKEPANLTLIAREISSGSIAGVFSFSQIFMKAFQNAYLGYYGISGFTGRGLMREAIHLVTHYGFTTIGLHRIEANIQPDNLRSIALVKTAGFQKEGYSPCYLRINGQWRDHERWALLNECH